MLAAAGVDRLLLNRELAPGAATLATRIGSFPTIDGELAVFELPGSPAAEAWFAGEVFESPHLNATLAVVTSAGFDPRRSVVLPAGGSDPGGAADGAGAVLRPGSAAGEVRILEQRGEPIEVEVSADGPGVVVFRRAHLPIYRAAIDEEPAPVVVANMDRAGVEVPAGVHRVRLWPDRRPLGWSTAVALLAVSALLALALRREVRGRLGGGARPGDGAGAG